MGNEKKIKLIEFQKYGDMRGQLVVAECGEDIPFEVKRIFYIYGSDTSVVRGQHANLKSRFLLINVAGSCKIKVKICNGKDKIYYLNCPYIGLYLPEMTWKEMYDFSSDSVLLVLASEHYDPEEYIRNYEEFLRRGDGKNGKSKSIEAGGCNGDVGVDA